MSIMIAVIPLFQQTYPLVRPAPELSSKSAEDALLLSFEPKKVFIIGSSDEGESVLFHVSMENRSKHGFLIEKLIIRFKKKGKVVLEQEQPESFFRQALIERERKIISGSSIRWTGICLTSASFGQLEEVDLLFHLRSGKRLRTTQTLQIPVSRYLQKTILRPPFKGLWKVTQGHQCASNHRISGHGGDFAWDFAALGPSGSIASEAYQRSRENKDVFGFGKEILAPAPGQVIRVKNDVTDNEGEHDHPRKSLSYEIENPLWVFGNFVIIDHKNGEYSLLGHMMQGSIPVKDGDEVKAGDVVGRCGNSGNTFTPHLHYQLMNGANPVKYEVNGLPALISGYSVFKPPTDFSDDLIPEDLIFRMEKVTNGDPVSGQIIEAIP